MNWPKILKLIALTILVSFAASYAGTATALSWPLSWLNTQYSFVMGVIIGAIFSIPICIVVLRSRKHLLLKGIIHQIFAAAFSFYLNYGITARIASV